MTLLDTAKSCDFLKCPAHEDSEKVYHVYGGQKFARLAVREVWLSDRGAKLWFILGVYLLDKNNKLKIIVATRGYTLGIIYEISRYLKFGYDHVF